MYVNALSDECFLIISDNFFEKLYMVQGQFMVVALESL